jgi:hypothetical protein
LDGRVAIGEGEQAIGGAGEAAAGKESTVVAGELRVVLQRAFSWQLRGKGGVAPRLRPPADHRGGPVVEVEADARRLPDGQKRRDGDGNEEVLAVVVGLSHEVDDAETCGGGKMLKLVVG